MGWGFTDENGDQIENHGSKEGPLHRMKWSNQYHASHNYGGCEETRTQQTAIHDTDVTIVHRQ